MSGFWSGKSVLVAGGAGFVGSYLVEELVQDGAQVLVADNLEAGNLENLSAVADRIVFLRGDLREAAFCEHATRSRDVVMNLAARAHGIGYAAGHQAELFTCNSLINLNLLEAARKNGVPRFLVVSSSCVYPDDAIAPTPELPVFTGPPELANEGYGWSKRMAELQAGFYAMEHHMEIAIVRAFNAYGARCGWRSLASHVIPSLIEKAMRGDDPMVVWGSGEQRRNFLHARDFAWGMKLLTERHATAEPVNLGFETTVSMKELVSAILRACGREGCRVEFDRTRPEGRAMKSADSSKLRAIAPEFKSRVSLEEGIREVVEWYRQSFSATCTAGRGTPFSAIAR